MAYNTQAVAQRPPTDVAGVTGAETISPEIIALTQAFLMASPEITLPQAVKAAYFFHNTGQVEGRDSYIGTTGRVTGKVLEGYRGVARDAAERGVGEVEIKYRPLTADEAEWHEVKPGDLARACEVYQLRAWRIAQRMGQPYEPIIGIGIVKPSEKVTSEGKPIPLIGGMTLALMTMPVIVISGRNAIKAVPPSIRDGALAIGASPVQVVFHHVLPLALPGMLTGTIIGMARALGETAPLLLIGMRIFVATPPEGFASPATVLPMQIFLWSDEIDRGFVERTSAAIIVLLVFLLTMNGLAIYLRNKFEKRW
jgi:hypothetical protein